MSKYIDLSECKELAGKTIKRAIYKGYKDYDDEDLLVLEMIDGTVFEITSGYGGYTGSSRGEYPSFVYVNKIVGGIE